jgi:hypothetical protein
MFFVMYVDDVCDGCCCLWMLLFVMDAVVVFDGCCCLRWLLMMFVTYDGVYDG